MPKTVLLAACVAALVPTSAFAQDKMPDVAVSYSDLDLAKPADVKRFDQRIAAAVKAACPSDWGDISLRNRRMIEACLAEKRNEVAPLRAVALAKAGQGPAVAAR